MESLVTVIVPVYNVEEFLDKCIESIVNQTYGNLEIILVDDGCTDNSPQKCDAWANNDFRIKVIHKENEGPGLARNSGLDIANGIYVTFVDSDDYLALDAIENMVKIIENDNSDLVVAQKIKVYNDGTEEPSDYAWMHDCVLDKEEALSMLGSKTKPFPASLWGRLYKKTIFDSLRFTNLKTAEDTYILPHIIARCNTISFTNKVVYFYFQRDVSIVHTVTREKSLDNIRAVLHVARYLLERDYLKEAKVYYNSAICQTIKLKHDKEAKRLIKNHFSKKERKALSKNRNKETILNMLIAQFPNAYKFYKKIKSH